MQFLCYNMIDICSQSHTHIRMYMKYRFNATSQLLAGMSAKPASESANTLEYECYEYECECNYSRVQVKPLTSRVAHRNRLISGGICNFNSFQ